MDRDCDMEVRIKRKRGRPRKSEISSSIKSSSSSGRDEMVGQVICGVVEASFEAGYLVNVQLTTSASIAGEDDDDDNNNNLRGVVFRGDKVCPITITNDVAPHAKMYLRKPHHTSIQYDESNKQQHSCHPPPPSSTTNKPSSSTCSTNPFLVPLSFPNTTHQQKPNPQEDNDQDMQADDDDDDNDDDEFHPPPKNTCTISIEEEDDDDDDDQEQADQLLQTRQLLSPTNNHQLFINSTTNYNTENLNLELNQPPTTTFIESQPPKQKLMDIFPTTFSNHAASHLPQNITDHHLHSTSSSSSSSSVIKSSTPQQIQEEQRPKMWDHPISVYGSSRAPNYNHLG